MAPGIKLNSERLATWQSKLPEILASEDPDSKVALHIAELDDLELEPMAKLRVLAKVMIGAHPRNKVDAAGQDETSPRIGRSKPQASPLAESGGTVPATDEAKTPEAERADALDAIRARALASNKAADKKRNSEASQANQAIRIQRHHQNAIALKSAPEIRTLIECLEEAWGTSKIFASPWDALTRCWWGGRWKETQGVQLTSEVCVTRLGTAGVVSSSSHESSSEHTYYYENLLGPLSEVADPEAAIQSARKLIARIRETGEIPGDQIVRTTLREERTHPWRDST